MGTSAAEVYEEHIRALPAADRLRLLAMIAGQLATEGAASEARDQGEQPQHSLLELRGLGKEIWAGVDAQEYVNRLRDEWHDPAP
jgi:hypothetical protein